MKKIAAILLSLALVFCMMPNTAFAFTPGADDSTAGKLEEGEVVKSIEITSKIPDKFYDGTVGEAALPEMTVLATFEKKSSNGTVITEKAILKKSEYEITPLTDVTNVGTVTLRVTEKLTGANQPTDQTQPAPVPKTCTVSYKIKQINLNRNVKVTIADGETLLPDDFETDENGVAQFKDSSKSKVNITLDGKDVKNASYLVIKYSKTTEIDTKSNKEFLKVDVVPASGIKESNVTGFLKPTFYVKKDISDPSVAVRLATSTLATTNPVYTGQEYKPKLVVEETIKVYEIDPETGKYKTDPVTGKDLLVDKIITIPTSEYTLEYINNIEAGPGSVLLAATGMNYTGSVVLQPFTIQRKPVSDTDVKITASTGSPLAAPTITATYKNMTLVKDKDFKLVSYLDGIAKIEGLGNFEGEKNVPYKVVNNQLKSVTCGKNLTFNNKNQEPELTVIGSDNNILTKNTDYAVAYTKDGKTVTPKEAGTYKAIVTGKGDYAGTLDATFTIDKVPLTEAEIVLSKSTITYNGQKVPKITVKSKSGITFAEKTDYTVSYRNLGSTSTVPSLKPMVVATPTTTGNLAATAYMKELTMPFDGGTGSIASCTVSFTDGKSTKVYDKKAVKPTVTVRDNSQNKNLTLNTDYTVAYKDSANKTVNGFTEIGSYKVVVTGKGKYTGEQTLAYSITATENDISHYTVTLNKSSVDANGLAQKPTIVSVKYTTLTLSPADYDVTYQDPAGKTVTTMITPGTYRVVVTGKNGYTGSTSASFRIVGTPQEMKIAKTAYKVYKNSPDITIDVTATGDGTGFSFVSSDPSVATVSATGVVTIHKIGRAKITVTTTGVTKSDPVSDDVYVKVHPYRSTLTQKPFTEGKKKSFRARWNKQDDVTYYEVCYSRTEKFRKGTYGIKKVKNADWLNYSTQSTQVKTSYSKRRYYVKVRAVKVVYNDYGKALRYYGKWSKWRSVVTR